MMLLQFQQTTIHTQRLLFSCIPLNILGILPIVGGIALSPYLKTAFLSKTQNLSFLYLSPALCISISRGLCTFTHIYTKSLPATYKLLNYLFALPQHKEAVNINQHLVQTPPHK